MSANPADDRRQLQWSFQVSRNVTYFVNGSLDHAKLRLARYDMRMGDTLSVLIRTESIEATCTEFEQKLEALLRDTVLGQLGDSRS